MSGPPANGMRKTTSQSGINKALSYIASSLKSWDLINLVPITTRAVGLCTELSIEVANRDSIRPIQDVERWRYLRAAYISFTAKLAHVHQHTNRPPDLIAMASYPESVENYVKSMKTFTLIRSIVDNVGRTVQDTGVYIPHVSSTFQVSLPIRPGGEPQPGYVRPQNTDHFYLPYPHELLMTNWQQVVAELQLDDPATLEWRTYFIRHAPFYIPSVDGVRITEETAQLMWPNGYSEKDQIADLQALERYLFDASPGLSSNLVLSVNGGVGQLIRTKKHQLQISQTGFNGGYGMDIYFYGTVNNTNEFRIGQFLLLGEYPHCEGPYANFDTNVYRHRGVIPWRQVMSDLASKS